MHGGDYAWILPGDTIDPLKTEDDRWHSEECTPSQLSQAQNGLIIVRSFGSALGNEMSSSGLVSVFLQLSSSFPNTRKFRLESRNRRTCPPENSLWPTHTHSPLRGSKPSTFLVLFSPAAITRIAAEPKFLPLIGSWSVLDWILDNTRNLLVAEKRAVLACSDSL